jgi:hypothetical protein
MQSEKIILIPPSDEQATPCFHVESDLLGAFLAHLASRGVEIWQPPEPLGPLGLQGAHLIEIEIKEEHPLAQLEETLRDFLRIPTISKLHTASPADARA